MARVSCSLCLRLQRGVVQGVAGQAGVVGHPADGVLQLHAALPQRQHTGNALLQRHGRRVLLLPPGHHQHILPARLVGAVPLRRL